MGISTHGHNDFTLPNKDDYDWPLQLFQESFTVILDTTSLICYGYFN